MNHNNINRDDNRWSTIMVILVCLLIVGGIIYMKYITDGQKSLSPSLQRTEQDNEVAIPDTSMEPGILPVTPDSVIPSVLPDTVLGKDTRLPYEAGYEDGYATGCDDGVANHLKASYDESNNFHTASEQKDYIRGYKEGYEEGFKDGKEGKQFNI